MVQNFKMFLSLVRNLVLPKKDGFNIMNVCKSYLPSVCGARNFASKKQTIHKDPKCNPSPQPPCSTKRIRRTPCRVVGKTKKKLPTAPPQQEPFISMWKSKPKHFKVYDKSMWLKPKCCIPVCPTLPTRFDDLYWKHSDKKTRKYQVTWSECGPLRMRHRLMCVNPLYVYKPLEKRIFSRNKKLPCPKIKNTLGKLLPCRPIDRSRCRKIKSCPDGSVARRPPTCKKFRGLSDCHKVCTPSPSFSECRKAALIRRCPSECRCLQPVAMCDVFRKYRGCF